MGGGGQRLGERPVDQLRGGPWSFIKGAFVTLIFLLPMSFQTALTKKPGKGRVSDVVSVKTNPNDTGRPSMDYFWQLNSRKDGHWLFSGPLSLPNSADLRRLNSDTSTILYVRENLLDFMIHL